MVPSNQAPLTDTPLFISFAVAGLHSALATHKTITGCYCVISPSTVQEHLFNSLSQHSGQLMGFDKHSCLVADKHGAVKTNAFSAVTAASLTSRAACSQTMHTDTGHHYVTALDLKSKYN